jgi:hypothetical protein
MSEAIKSSSAPFEHGVPSLKVAIYRASPSPHELAHWSIAFINDALESTIYENVGTAVSFRFQVLSANATPTKKFDRYITIAERSLSAEDIHEAMNDTVTDDVDPGYNCQHFVMNALKHLGVAGVITSVEYQAALEKLQEPVGVCFDKCQIPIHFLLLLRRRFIAILLYIFEHAAPLYAAFYYPPRSVHRLYGLLLR